MLLAGNTSVSQKHVEMLAKETLSNESQASWQADISWLLACRALSLGDLEEFNRLGQIVLGHVFAFIGR